MPMQLTSPAFEHEAPIPAKFTCKGEDLSPPLAWASVPAGTESFVLICDDPDAPDGTWDHWVLYNLPRELRELAEGDSENLPQEVLVGVNSWGREEYGGPCPPSGMHRYFFRIYALDKALNLPPGASKQEVLNTMGASVLDHAELMGVFSKD